MMTYYFYSIYENVYCSESFKFISNAIMLAYVWYHSGHIRITVTHHDFTEATECSFWKITVDYRDSSISTELYQTYT
jgi:Zn-dependent M32 family carboxypeptidase